jgi:hypothetical protein
MDRAADPRTSSTTSRSAFVTRGSLAAATLAFGAGLGLAGRATSAGAAAPSAAQDRAIFNFALLLEYLQAAFYTEAVEQGRDFAEIVSDHERAHVAYLRRALGEHARPRPKFDFGNATQSERAFVKTAVLLENTGVAAYNGQAANLTKPALAAAAEIVSVEGRHAAWISDIAGESPAPRAADLGEASADVVRKLESLGFLRAS